jgi:Pyruvate/2-oxoacid:ferredoxin oxidoreductase gamma subunit
MTGHSISEIILSPNEVYYTGIDRPNIFIALAKEGMKTTRRQFEAMSKEDTLYVRRDLLPMSTPARTIPMDIERTSRKEVAVTAISAVLRHSNLYPLDAFREAIRIIQRPALAEDSLKAVDKSPILTG